MIAKDFKSCSQRTRKRGGFYTLKLAVSLAVVLFLCAILSTQGGGAIIDSAMTAKAKSEISALGCAIAEYSLEIGEYPENMEALTQKKGQYGPWLKTIPDADPWGNPYKYKFSDDGFAVYSYGANKSDDGSDENKIQNGDIGVVGK